jgi:non-homologous end joining protein Ku
VPDLMAALEASIANAKKPKRTKAKKKTPAKA